MRLIFIRLIATAVLSSLAACQSATPGSTSQRMLTEIDPTLSAGENLTLLARAEAEAEPPAGPPGSGAPPPGLDAATFRPRSADDARAWLSLDEAMKLVVSETLLPAASPGEATPPGPDKIAQAERHYVRGSEAAELQRWYVAITELEAAMKLDPTSPAIVRRLARSYRGIGNATRAAQLYATLRSLAPDDPEASLIMGMTAANRRDDALAAALIADVHLAGGDFDFDPASAYLAPHVLSMALRNLGYDAAFIESAQSAVALPGRLPSASAFRAEIVSLYGQRGTIWRSIGDAYSRLGDHGRALESYTRAMALAAVGDSLLPRVLYANLALGRPFTAQLQLLRAMNPSTRAVNARFAHLVSYLAEFAQPVTLLAESISVLAARQPDDAELTRAAAALSSPGDAIPILQAFLARHPEAADVRQDLFAQVAARGGAALAELGVGLAVEEPGNTRDIVDQLMRASGRPLDVVNALEQTPASLESTLLRAGLLVRLGGLGEAWRVCADGLEEWPDDRRLVAMRLELAAALREPELLDDASFAANRFDDAAMWLVRSRARRQLGQATHAIEAASRAVELDPADPDALAEHAASLVMVRPRAAEAQQQAVGAIAIDPHHDAAYAVLIDLFSPGGPAENQSNLSSALRKLVAEYPDSPLLARIRADEAIARSRFDDAIEILLPLYERNRLERTVVTALVTAWLGLDAPNVAETWLNARLQSRPGDPLLLEGWVRVALNQKRGDEAADRMRALLRENPDDPVVTRLLETILLATENTTQGYRFTEARLLDRPDGLRRQLDLAALYIESGRTAEAIALLDGVLDRFADAPRLIVVQALTLSGRLPAGDPEAEAARYRLVDGFIDRYPDAPISIHGAGLIALVGMGALDDRFDALLQAAIYESPEGRDPGLSGMRVFRDLAQALYDAGSMDAAMRLVKLRMDSTQRLHPDARRFLGQLLQVGHVSRGDGEAAIAVLQRLQSEGVIRTLPLQGREGTPLADALYSLSVFCTLIGQDDAADLCLRRAIDLAPGHAMALNNLGYRLVELGRDDDETAQLIERALTITPDNSNILDTAGWLRYKQGRLEDAGNAGDAGRGAFSLVTTSLKTTERDGEELSAEVFDHLGDIHWRLQRPEKALQAWEQALEILQNPERRRENVRNFASYQTDGWGLLIVKPQEVYDRQYGPLLGGVRAKIDAVGRGDTPPIAPTFAELNHAD